MLTIFGFVAVTLMVVFYSLEARSPWFVFAFAASCVLASLYAALQRTWPFASVEAVWSIVAFRRWWIQRLVEKR